MEDLVKLGQIAGIAGISLGIIFLIFKQIIAEKILKIFTQEQAYNIVRLMVKVLLVIGLVGIVLWSFKPLIDKLANNTNVQSPFGDQEILLKDKELFLSKSSLDEKAGNDVIKEAPYLFQIAKPDSSKYRYEFISAQQYVDDFAASTFSGLPAQLFDSTRVFRIFRKDPINVETTPDTYMGTKSAPAASAPNLLQQIRDSLKNDNSKKGQLAREMMNATSIAESIKFKLFNELAIVVFNKDDYRKYLTSVYGGRQIEPNPFNFIIAAGGTLPTIDVPAINKSSVSKDNKIWGFYGENKYNNINVNGHQEKVLYSDFYRIYTMNDKFIYQITLTYVSDNSTPVTTWDDLLAALQSLKIVE